jgi:serine/threonine protein kinase/WD40 repeat protein
MNEPLLDEQRRRWEQGEPVLAETYLEQHPALCADKDALLDLIYNEILLREKNGERPNLQEYEQRFPSLAGELRLQFEVDRELAKDGLLGLTALPASEPKAAADLPSIPGYTVLNVLGRGGMGVVYKAWHRELKRLVTIKMLRESLPDAEERGRFRTEAEAVARLRHSQIVQIHEIGEHAGRPFCVLEFIEGGSLEDKLQGLPQPPRQAARLVELLAGAVHFAHQHGVVHRDLKPANILLQRKSQIPNPKSEKPHSGTTSDLGFAISDLEPKVTDFGLAKRLDDDSGQTRSGAIVGTPNYMAPEQAGGQSKAIGPAADVYALGAILYEMLTGRPPFRGVTVLDTLDQVRSREPVPPSQLQPGTPRDLETICLMCLRKEPQRRYTSAAGLAEDLCRFQAGEPVRARPISGLSRAWRWCRRNPGAAMAAALVLLIAIGASLLALGLNMTLGRTRRAEHQATDRLFEALLTRVRASRGSGRPGQRFANLESLRQAVEIARAQDRPAADLLELRNQAIACLALPDLQLEKEWEGNQPGTNGLGFDAAFERYAWSFQDEGIRVRRLTDHVELFRVPTPPSDRVSRWVLLGFSPNGRYLAAYYVQWGEKHPLEVWELGEGSGRRVVTLPDVTGLPAFAADGRSLVAPLPGGEAAVMALPSGQERRRLAAGGPAEALALHPGGKLLGVAGGQSDGVRVLDLETGSVAHRLPHPDTVQGLAWSADGKLLATACNDLRIHLWDGVSWQKQGELAGHRWEVGDVAFDPTGRWLASFGWDMTLRVWEVGSRRQVVNVEDIRVLGFRSQEGLAAAGLTGRRVQVWGFRPSQVFQELHPHPTIHPVFKFSPDGRWLTTWTGVETEMRVWDMGTYREVYRQLGQRMGPSPDAAWFLSQGPDGYSLVPVSARPSGREDLPAIRFGPPRLLTGLQEDVRDQFALWVGPEGRRLLLIDPPSAHLLRSRVRLLQLNGETIRVVWECRKPNANWLAGSRDGRLVAVGSYGGGNGVSVWEADTGRLVRELPIGDANLTFAADGHRLYTTTGRLSPRGAECRSWWIGSWEPDRALPLERTSHTPADMDVAADGTVAVLFTMSDVRLLAPETLEEIVSLSAPEPGLVHGPTFSPDGTKLVTAASGTVHVWDLRRLHQELAGLGLDWSAAPLPPENRKP